METMETSGKTTHLWVNNIDMDILVGPQAEHLCNCLIHTDRFCHENERARKEVNAPSRFQMVYRYKTNTARLFVRQKSQVCLNHTHSTQTKADLELTVHFLLKF